MNNEVIRKNHQRTGTCSFPFLGLCLLISLGIGSRGEAASPEVLWEIPRVPFRVEFMPHEQMALTQSPPGEVEIRRIEDWQVLRTLPVRDWSGITPDGLIIYSMKWINEDGGKLLIQAWQTADGQLAHSWTIPIYYRADQIVLTADARYLAVKSKNNLPGGEVGHTQGNLSVYRVSDGKRLWGKEAKIGPHGSGSFSVVVSPTGDTVTLTEAEARYVEVHRMEDGQLLFTPTLNGTVSSVRYSPDGRRLAVTYKFTVYTDSGPQTRTMTEIWDVSGRSHYRTIPDDSEASRFIDHDRYLSISGDQTQLHDLTDNTIVYTLPISGESLIFSPDGSRMLLRAGNINYYLLYNTATGEIVKSFTPAGDFLYPAVLLSPDGEYLLTDSKGHTKDERAMIWRTRDGVPIVNMMNNVKPLTFSPDSRTLATVGALNLVDLWDSEGNDRLYRDFKRRIQPGTIPVSPTPPAGFTPDGRQFATVFRNLGPEVRLWDRETGEIIRAFDRIENEHIRSLDFSPDGRLMATGSWPSYDRSIPTESRVRLWDVSNGELIQVLEGTLSGDVTDVDISPDGQLVAGGDTQGLTKVWRTADGGLQYTFPGPASPLESLEFLSGSSDLAIAYRDGTVRIHRMSDGSRTRTLRADQVLPGGSRYLTILGDQILFRRMADDTVYATIDAIPEGRIVLSPDGQLMAYRQNESLIVARIPDLSEGTKGDLNVDGVVNISDAIVLLQSLVGLMPLTETQKTAADMDSSGSVDLGDVVALLRYVVGLTPSATPFAHIPVSDNLIRREVKEVWNLKQTLGATALPVPSIPFASYPQYNELILASANNDIWQGIWEPAFLYQDGLTGDFSMRVQVREVPGCSPLSGAGLMVAQSVPDRINSSAEIPTWGLILLTRSYGVEAKWGGQGISQTSLTAASPDNVSFTPKWLRLDRKGNVLSFYVGTKEPLLEDPYLFSDWQTVSEVNLGTLSGVSPLRGTITAGIVMQTHCGEVVGEAAITRFQVLPIP